MTRADEYDQIREVWPREFVVSQSVPQRAREFLTQAANSLNAPAGAVVLAAGAVDAMLKAKGYKEGVLNGRIKAAAEAHLITPEMAAWAHEVRLDANDQRHADEDAPLPNDADAERSIQFAQALAQFLFVLPASVAASRRATAPHAAASAPTQGASALGNPNTPSYTK